MGSPAQCDYSDNCSIFSDIHTGLESQFSNHHLIYMRFARLSSLARKSNFRIIPMYLYTSTEKQKVAWGSLLSFCFSVEVDSFKGKIRKVDFRGSIFFSRRIDPCSRMSRKQKRSEMLWPTHTQRSRHLFSPLALTMSKKPFETFLKNDCFKNSFTKVILCLKA